MSSRRTYSEQFKICLVILSRTLLGAWPPERKWTVEDVAVECWKLDPQTFGLSGYERLYLDYHKVLCHFCGKRGLINQGLFRWIEPRLDDRKLVEITSLGTDLVLRRVGYEEGVEGVITLAEKLFTTPITAMTHKRVI